MNIPQWRRNDGLRAFLYRRETFKGDFCLPLDAALTDQAEKQASSRQF